MATSSSDIALTSAPANRNTDPDHTNAGSPSVASTASSLRFTSHGGGRCCQVFFRPVLIPGPDVSHASVPVMPPHSLWRRPRRHACVRAWNSLRDSAARPAAVRKPPDRCCPFCPACRLLPLDAEVVGWAERGRSLLAVVGGIGGPVRTLLVRLRAALPKMKRSRWCASELLPSVADCSAPPGPGTGSRGKESPQTQAARWVSGLRT